MFNPIIQGERYDPDGDYVRRWVPELAHVAGKRIHQPIGTPEPAGTSLFDEASAPSVAYPAPIVDHREARERFLAARGVLDGDAASA